MAKKAYIGVDGVARKIKKGYVGVDGVARKIKKAYIGIGGVARPCWSGGDKVGYFGTTTELQVAKYNLSATTVGNYAIFAGGNGDSQVAPSGSDAVKSVDAYSGSLTKTMAPSLDYHTEGMQAATVGDYALFAGGYIYGLNGANGWNYSKRVTAYDKSLTKINATDLNSELMNFASASIGNYALFAGGVVTSSDVSSTVMAYDISLTKTLPTALSQGRMSLSGASSSKYALFGGGYIPNLWDPFSSTTTSQVHAYNTSLTRSEPTSLRVARQDINATNVGNYVLFGGGFSVDPSSGLSSYFNDVDAYNDSLVRSNTTFSESKYRSGATNLGKYAIFAGGINSNNKSTNVVEMFDVNLTRSNECTLIKARDSIAATSVGDYALFGGGSDGPYSATVEVFTLV